MSFLSLLFLFLPRKTCEFTKAFLSLPNPLKPWKSLRKHPFKEGNSFLKIYQGSRNNQGKEGQGGSVRFGYGLVERFRFSVPAVPLRRGFLWVSAKFHREDGSGSGFGSWKTVPAVPVPLSVPVKTVPTVPLSGSGSVPGPPWFKMSSRGPSAPGVQRVQDGVENESKSTIFQLVCHRPLNGPFQRGRFPISMGRFPECLNGPFSLFKIHWKTAH